MDVQHGVGVQVLLHRRLIRVAVPDDDQQRDQKKDLHQQRLHDAALVADVDGDQERDHDRDVDEQGFAALSR